MPISWGWYLLLSASFAGLLGLVIWLLVEYFKEKEEPRDDPIAINFCSHLSEGRFMGTQVKVDIGKDGRYVCMLDPKDLSPKTHDKPKLVTVIVDNNKLVPLPKGRPSKERNFVIYLPPSAEEIPSEMRDTLIGKAMCWATELKNYEKTVIDILREGADRRDELLQKIGDGEISKEFIQFQEGLVADYLKKIINPKDIKEKSSISLTGGSHSTTNPST